MPTSEPDPFSSPVDSSSALSADLLAALGISDATALSPVAGGWDTLLWKVERGGTTCALRVFRPDQAAQCRREVAVLQAAAQSELPVPRVHASAVAGGRPAILMAWCPGEPVLSAVRARPWTAWALGTAMGRVQARLHAAPVPTTLVDLLPPWIPRAGEQELPLQRLLQAQASRPAALLHLDYHPLNVMCVGWRLSGVLDWANAAVGDPRADLARTVTLLRIAPLPPGIPLALGLGLRLVLEAGWRTGYQRLAGRIGPLAPFYAWAGAMMERDLRPRLGRADVWLQPRDLERIHGWTVTWKRRTGLPS